MLGSTKAGLKTVDRLFRDTTRTRTVTYSLYKGRDVAPQTFSILAYLYSHQIGDESYQGVSTQEATRRYFIRTADLPSGVTRDSLTRNDTITDAGQEFSIVEMRKNLDFLVKLIVSGDA